MISRVRRLLLIAIALASSSAQASSPTAQEAQFFRNAQADAKRAADELLEAAKSQAVTVTARAIERLQAAVRGAGEAKE